MFFLIKFVLPLEEIFVPAAAYFSMITTVSYNNMTTVQLIGEVIRQDLMIFYFQISEITRFADGI